MKCSHENSLEKIATPFFWILPYFFSFLGLAVYEITYFISHSLWSFNGISVGSNHNIRMHLENALVVFDLHGLFLLSGRFSV